MKLNFVIAVLSSFVYQVQGVCENPLGMRDGRINNTQITSPSVRGHNLPHHARPGHFTKTWCSAARRFSYIQVTLGREHAIQAITLEGGGFRTLVWVTSYTISYRSGGKWKYYEEGGKKKFLEGVRGFNKNNKISLNDVTADAIRVHPQNVDGVSVSSSKIEHACLKLELFGCPAAECKQLSRPEHGQIHSMSTKHSANASFSCDVGYKLNGSSTLKCQADGSWDGPPPKCSVVDCGELPTPSNGRKVVETRTTYNGTVEIACDSGHELAGSPVRKCQGNGQWSGESAVCQAVSCRDPGTPKHSSRELHHGFNFGDAVRYRCSAGHVMFGSAVIVCQENKTWNASIPKCLASCPNPGNPNFGQRLGENFQHGSKVRFQCAHNYVISGPSVIDCKEGKWSGPVPRCMAPCNHPGKPKHGKKFGSDYRHGQTVRFGCDAGYKMKGVHNITCSNSRWSGKKPRCVGQCPKPVAPANGIKVEALKLGHIREVKFKCRQGYTLVGSAVIRCIGTRWESSFPQCKASCANPRAPRNGRRIGDDYTHGHAVRFVCAPNYKLEGDSLISCSDGKWSGPTPLCRATCPQPPPLKNGITTSRTVRGSEHAEFQCNQGYQLRGSAVIDCIRGKWRGAVPACIDLDECSVGPCDVNALCENTDGSFICRCREGFFGDGKTCQDYDECQTQTHWCHDNATCTNTLGSYMCQCEKGFTGDGRQCTATNQGCQRPSIPHGARLRGRRPAGGGKIYAFFSCKPGFYLVGRSMITCTKTTGWTPPYFRCIAVDCGFLPTPLYGEQIVDTGTSFGGRIVFRCRRRGYELSGSRTRICQRNGRWSGSLTRCLPVKCKDPGTPTHGSRVISTGLIYGGYIDFRCHVGYTLVGWKRIFCQANKKWVAPAPTCKMVNSGSGSGKESGSGKGSGSGSGNEKGSGSGSGAGGPQSDDGGSSDQ